MAALLDVEKAADFLASTLMGVRTISSLRIAYVRYDPGRRLLVRYEVESEGAEHGAFAVADCERDLAALAADRESLALARRVADQTPTQEPLVFEPRVGALIQWLPLDLRLPALLESPERLREEIVSAGLEIEPDDFPELIKHKPMRRAVMRLTDHVVKIYARGGELARSVHAFHSVSVLPLRVPRCEAIVPRLLLAVQSRIAGSRPQEHLETAGRAGALLSILHHSGLRGLPLETPAQRLGQASAEARFAGTIVPELLPQAKRLTRRLERELPHDLPLLPTHGDFHISQLLEADGEVGVVDFDTACRAPVARDLGYYIAAAIDSVDDLAQADAILRALCEGYGEMPPALAWYAAGFVLRRARRPFTQFQPGWPAEVAARVATAEATLDLG